MRAAKTHEQFANEGGYGNHVLYKMCKARPEHTDPKIVGSKIWIIGRAYAATIERQGKKRTKKDEDEHDHVASIIYREPIDDWIKNVSSIHKLTSKNIEKSLECHKNMVELLKPFTRKKKRSLRSFVSKYLHFHKPLAFFIYDSRATARIKDAIKQLSNRKQHFKFPRGYDDTYAAFCARCIYYRDEFLEKHLRRKVKVTPRVLDMWLLRYGIFAARR
jgi:hypothetical protein